MVDNIEVIVDGDKENKSIGLSRITPALAQALYSQITNNSEKMRDRCDDSLLVTDDSINQLMHCMQQTIEQYDCQASSLQITIKHKKGNTLVLSGMDPYSRYNRSETKPIAELIFKFSALISNPSVKKEDTIHSKYSEYETTVSILPDILNTKDDLEAPRFIRKLMNLSKPSAVVEIKYVDYTIARALNGAVKDWLETVKCKEPSKIVKFMVKNSEKVESLASLFFILMGLFIAIKAKPNFSNNQSQNFDSLVNYLMFGCVLLLSIFMLRSIISLVHEKLMPIMTRSCSLEVNAGDKKNSTDITKAFVNRPKKIVGFIGSIVFAILMQIFSLKILPLLSL